MSPIIVALDVPTDVRALELARLLQPHVAMVKVGLELFVAYGPDFVRKMRDTGVGIFLDLKLHDIPRTVGAACKAVSALDVQLLTIHAGGGGDMVKAAREHLHPRTHLLAVSVLTSLNNDDVARLGVSTSASTWAEALAKEARAHGADGLVCSAHELTSLKPLGGSRVVPGIRPAGSDAGDQKRTANPKEAMAAGATYLVIGRPIVEAADPVAAAKAINASL